MIQEKKHLLNLITMYKNEQNCGFTIFSNGSWSFFNGDKPIRCKKSKINFGTFTPGQLTPGIIEAIEEAIAEGDNLYKIECILNE